MTREALWKKYNGDKKPSLERSFLVYDRYDEAGRILKKLKDLGVFKDGLRVLDFGCGVSDYGIFFARLGATVSIFDSSEAAIKFASWRFEQEKLPFSLDLSGEFDLVIFGEVLEHLDSPLSSLEMFNTKFIFTSSYPYRSNDPNNEYWKRSDHSDSARKKQPECRKFLEENFDRFIIDSGTGQASLWRKKS